MLAAVSASAVSGWLGRFAIDLDRPTEGPRTTRQSTRQNDIGKISFPLLVRCGRYCPSFLFIEIPWAFTNITILKQFISIVMQSQYQYMAAVRGCILLVGPGL